MFKLSFIVISKCGDRSCRSIRTPCFFLLKAKAVYESPSEVFAKWRLNRQC